MQVISTLLLLICSSLLSANTPLLFPNSFLKGVAFSVHQNGGDLFGRSNWSVFEQKKTVLGTPTVTGNQRCNSSVGFWQKGFEDIALLQELGCNSVRFSVEWSAIEPEPGVFNEVVLNFYERYCDALIAAGIQPTVTLHHFTHPHWFDVIGGFEKEINITYFVRFCKVVFSRLNNKVALWYTINEPTVYSFMGYILGMHSPGKTMHFTLAGTVLKNLLLAHVRVYQELKKLPGGQQAQIGIVHQLLRAQAYSEWSPFGKFTAWFLNFCAAHKQTKKFLETGIFEYKIPGIVNVQTHCPEAPQSYDFIGINYYSRVVTGITGPTCFPNEVMTDMEYAIYPDGIYNAIAEMATLGVPMYITENGIPDAKDEHRAEFIKNYLKKVHEAVLDGYDVRGYFYWTLMDNYEWDRGFTQKFGLYQVDLTNLNRVLRPGAEPFKDHFLIANRA